MIMPDQGAHLDTHVRLNIRRFDIACFVLATLFLAHLSRSDKVSFCDQSLSVVRHPPSVNTCLK